MVTGNPVVESIIETNRYLLIDSSREIFDKFYYNYINTVNILNGTISSVNSERIIISECKFMTDSLNVLISLPSFSYIWNKNEVNFKFIKLFIVDLIVFWKKG